MDLFERSERLMGMDDATWASHANPWSVYTRFTALPLLCLAIWSRVWLGWWAMALVLLAILWVWLNPRIFAPPAHTESWAARGTFGERVFLNRKTVSIPAEYVRWGYGLSAASGIGLLPLIWGLWQLNMPWVVTGLVISMGAKTWFVDRMAQLYDRMQDADPTYAGWMRYRSNVAKTGA